MKREDALKIAKPILFNTGMVSAILDGRKTVTRRVVKLPARGYFEHEPPRVVPKYSAGDILYVRETWKEYEKRVGGGEDLHIEKFIAYKADESNPKNPSEFYKGNWKPSIHMPKSIARIFLKVTDVRVERLRDMTLTDLIEEGILEYGKKMPVTEFTDLWNSTIKKQDLDQYGWSANPWIWVIGFEMIEGDSRGKIT